MNQLALRHLTKLKRFMAISFNPQNKANHKFHYNFNIQVGQLARKVMIL